MHLVDDVYSVFAALGSVYRRIAQISDIVNAVVGGCVDLNYIGQSAAVGIAADVTFKARIAVLHIAAVYRLCKNSRTGGLARTP